ncbi:MAG TPA: Rieske (2Fe-2S) protein [Patescibacteria group bacterium]|jgi:cytochrome b6-f complex iron-sulfur subunit|nr:Rieske (2Fe-2S) protein [Patescibacteria group bacterium]
MNESHREPEQDGPGQGRRSALRWLIGGFLSLWGLGAAAVALSFLRAPTSARRAGEGQVRCGSFSGLPVGAARLVRHGAEPLFVLRVSDTEALALSAVCTHLRCVLTWDDAKKTILCPCHAGSFDRNGNVLSGPPTRALRQFAAEVRADEILVHL